MKTDPTKTLMLREAAVREVNRRFAKVRIAVRDAVLVGGLVTNVTVRQGQFQYTRDVAKIPEFNKFLQGVIDTEILDIENGVQTSDHWLNVYVGNAYERGAKKVRALAERNITDISKLPDYSPLTNLHHIERAELIFQRVYSELEGVTEVMSKQISTELANGIIRGKNPKDVAAAMTDRVDKIGISRSRLIARTEIVESHNQASANEAELLMRETGVEIEMEWITAIDGRERPSHHDRHGKVYPIATARGMLGEPNCRCSISAKIDLLKIVKKS